MRVSFPDGTVVQATGLGRPDDDPHPDFGLYLDDEWRALWPHEMIPWPDYGIPQEEEAAFTLIVQSWERARAGAVVEVGCAAGVGRTGTVLACMALLAGVPGSEAVLWVRRNFRGAAVETRAQEELVLRFATHLASNGEPADTPQARTRR